MDVCRNKNAPHNAQVHSGRHAARFVSGVPKRRAHHEDDREMLRTGICAGVGFYQDKNDEPFPHCLPRACRLLWRAMKNLFLLLLVGLISAPSLLADWVLLQNSTTDGKTDELKIQIKGGLSRLDAGKDMTMISGEDGIVMLMHAQKMQMKLDPDKMKGLLALAGAALGGDKPADKPKASGQKEKVGEYECEIYTWSGRMGSGKFWIAPDFKGYQELAAAQDKMMQAMGNPAASFAPQAGDFPGMVIKSEMTVMGKSNTTELVSAKEQDVDAAVFTVPEGYNEMKMPGLPVGK